MRTVALAAIVLLATPGCQRPAGEMAAPVAPCPSPSGDASGWQVMDHGDFAFRLPPGFVQQDVQPVDSRVEVYERGAAKVSFDMGQYSSDLRNTAGMFSEYQWCTDTIGGRDAFVITGIINNAADTAQHGRYVAAATWRNLPRPGSDSYMPLHLTMWTETRDAGEVGELLRVVRSVTFD